MRRPVVGVIGNAFRIENRFATQMVGERNLRAVAEVAGALPLMFAGTPDITDIGALLDAVGTRTVAFEDRTLHSYVGGWPEYVRVREERERATAAGRPPPRGRF